MKKKSSFYTIIFYACLAVIIVVAVAALFMNNNTEEPPVYSDIIGYFEKVIEYIKTFTGETLQQKTENFLIKSGITQIQIDSIKKNVLI